MGMERKLGSEDWFAFVRATSAPLLKTCPPLIAMGASGVPHRGRIRIKGTATER
jgi:hypothetical protein